MFQTKITSQGTISIPAALRKKYDLKPGETVTVEDTGKITISKSTDFASLREKNAAYLSGKHIPYQSGAGLEAYVNEKYGQ
jgi:AbrB family looped-hinge helix DNA binding protein